MSPAPIKVPYFDHLVGLDYQSSMLIKKYCGSVTNILLSGAVYEDVSVLLSNLKLSNTQGYSIFEDHIVIEKYGISLLPVFDVFFEKKIKNKDILGIKAAIKRLKYQTGEVIQHRNLYVLTVSDCNCKNISLFIKNFVDLFEKSIGYKSHLLLIIDSKDQTFEMKCDNMSVKNLSDINSHVSFYDIIPDFTVQYNNFSCTGCGACCNVCPSNAIDMSEDEQGFIRPIVSSDCISCKLCLDVCPSISYDISNTKKPKCIALMGDDEIRKDSSSGGMFTLLSLEIFRRGGVVVGAAYSDDFRSVYHYIAHNMGELDKLRRSKYVESSIGFVLRDVKKYLEMGTYVLYSGCPCQIAGLYKYLGKKYNTLLTCDLLCHAGNSRSALRKFLDDRESNSRKVVELNFREKNVFGWSTPTFIRFDDNSEYRRHASQCTWYVGFLNAYINRICCSYCRYATLPRVGDISLGDFWHIKKYDNELDDNCGTSLVLLNNEKGNEFFSAIRDHLVKTSNVPLQVAIDTNAALSHPQKMNLNRNLYFKNVCRWGYDKTINYVSKRYFDVGLVCWWMNDNYGGILTSFALHEAISNLGYSVLMIDIPSMTVSINESKRDTMSRIFAQNHYITSEFVGNMDKLNDYCDIFVTGSDQLWSYSLRQKSTNRFDYHLEFVNRYKKKISYASSFGEDTYEHMPADYKKIVRTLLSRFDYISVREDYGVDVCHKLGMSANQVLDPVFLIPSDVYVNLIKSSFIELPTHYLFAFILDPDDEKVKCIAFLSKKLNLPVYIITDPVFVNSRKELFRQYSKNVVEADIDDFINVISKATFVLTDSYHGTCFSIIFNKQFLSVANVHRGIRRFSSLSNLLPPIVNNIVRINDIKDIKKIPTVNYHVVNQIISENRIKSLNCLKNALGLRKLNPDYGNYAPVLAADIEHNNPRATSSKINYPVELKKWQTYSNVFSSLLKNKLLICELIDYFKSNNYKNIALYGYNEICKVLCSVFKNSPVLVNYVIDDLKLDEYVTYRRNADYYPDVDCIVVCDIVENKKICNQLKAISCNHVCIMDVLNELNPQVL